MQRDLIGELIEKVDDPVHGWKPLSMWKRFQLIGLGDMVLFVGAMFYLIIVYYAVENLLPSVGTPETLLIIIIGLVGLVLNFFHITKELTPSEEREKIIRVTTDWNYERIRKRVENEHWLLLKALMLMKTFQKDFKLCEARKKYPSLFNEENLVGMLYNMSPISIGTHREKNTEGNTEPKEENEKPNNDSLIAEYQVLNDRVNSRSRDMLLVESIMIPSTLTIVTFAIMYREKFGVNILGLQNSGFVPFVSFVLLVFLLYLRRTTIRINNISFDRIHEIEKDLQIKGNRYIREQTRCKTWFKIRSQMWYFIYTLVMGAYLFAMIHLFGILPLLWNLV